MDRIDSPIPGVTDVGPEVCWCDGKLYVIHKGALGDNQLYVEVFDGTGWTTETLVNGGRSGVGASIVTDGQMVMAVWRGGVNAERMLYAYEFGERMGNREV